jgi:ADP-ribose pyrophosphatase YjhB (NUDIX family)
MKTHETKSAGGIIRNKKGEVLLVEQDDLVWSLPKGHLEGSETPFEAAIREIKEETSLTQVNMICELGHYSRYKIAKGGGDDLSELKTIYYFLFETDVEEVRPEDPAILSAKWFKPEDVVAQLHHEKDKEFFKQVMKKYF